MKVIKRDGRIVEFDKLKIKCAIEKANSTVHKKERAKIKEIESIIKYIEKLDKKRILVEDIQDLIEIKLMEYKHYDLAKRYIVYRYNRALIRQQNTTDETILGLIRKNNLEYVGESKTNDIGSPTWESLIVSEVSRDLSKRLLLPEKINQAHSSGILYFHNMDSFLQPILGNSLIDLRNMLLHDLMINNINIKAPKSFQEACCILTQILINVLESQYGGVSVELKHLGKYLKMSQEKYENFIKRKYKNKISEEVTSCLIQDLLKKELSSAIQSIFYQLNTAINVLRKNSSITLFMHLDQDDLYIKECASIYEEVFIQVSQLFKNINVYPCSFPTLLYVLDENNIKGVYNDITKKAIYSAKKYGIVNFISSKKMRQIYKGFVHSPIGMDLFPPLYKENDKYIFEGRFHQGTITINLAQIAFLSNASEQIFYELLNERLDLCFEGLMCRHYALLNVISDVSPMHYQLGAIATLEKHQKINELLKSGRSVLCLGYVGLLETVKVLTGESILSKKGSACAIKLLQYLKKVLEKWGKKTGILFQLYPTTSKEIVSYLSRLDFENLRTNIPIYETCFKVKMNNTDEVNYIDILQKTSVGIPVAFKTSDLENKKWSKFVYENILYIVIEKEEE